MEMSKVYEFPCGRWLAKDEDDGQTQRDLLCGVGPDDAPPGWSPSRKKIPYGLSRCHTKTYQKKDPSFGMTPTFGKYNL